MCFQFTFRTNIHCLHLFIYFSAQESFNKPEEMKDNSGVHHLVKEMSAVKSSVEYLTRVVNKLAMTVFQDSPLTSGYRDSTIITPLEERNSYSLPLHTNNSKKHAGGTIIGRKLFDPESDEIIDLYSTHEPVYGINIGLKGGVKIPEVSFKCVLFYNFYKQFLNLTYVCTCMYSGSLSYIGLRKTLF